MTTAPVTYSLSAPAACFIVRIGLTYTPNSGALRNGYSACCGATTMRAQIETGLVFTRGSEWLLTDAGKLVASALMATYPNRDSMPKRVKVTV